MSELSKTISFLSNYNLNSTIGSGTALKKDDRVAIVTEQFIPRRQSAVFGDQFIFQTATQRRIKAKLVLLAPSPCDIPPFAKSVMYLSNLTGPISATVHRQPGVETHFFRLYIFARDADVKVTLPSLFRGVVHVKNQDGIFQSGRAGYCSAFRDRMRCGFIRLDSHVLEDEDEVYIHAQGRIRVRLMRGGNENMGSRVARHVRRIMGAT